MLKTLVSKELGLSPTSVDDSGADSLVHDVRRSLTLSADRAGLGALFRALVSVDASMAATILCDAETAVRAALQPEQLSRLVEEIIVSGDAQAVALPTEFPRLARAFADLATPDAIARVAEHEDASGTFASDLVASALKRNPRQPRLLRLAAEMAIRRHDAREAHARLTELGRADSSVATMRHIARLRGRIPFPATAGVRVALLSSFTIEPLAPYVDLECRALGLAPELYIAPFNSWAQEILGEASALRRFEPDVAFLSVSIDDLIPNLAGSPGTEELNRAGAEAVNRLVALAAAFSSRYSGLLVVHGLHSAYAEVGGVATDRATVSRASWLGSLNSRLRGELAAIPRVHLLDMHELLLRRRGGALENTKMRLLAGMRLGEGVLVDVAESYARFIAPAKSLTKKCIVLDLDNTLWGGVVGEDGLRGVRLGVSSPGLEYVEFQRFLYSLTERGFLLAVNSKNNADDALEVLRNHDSMILREESFSAMRINWLPKPDNMRSIAEELGIGLDALVFVDDNPSERALMRQLLPEVLTPELPSDPASYRACLERLPHLQTLTVTDEDRRRGEMYRERRARDAMRVQASSLEEYLAALEIEVQVSPGSHETLSRVQQLFQRTNQFNTTTRRYALGVLAERIADESWRLYTLHVRDRFGDHGLVAAALVQASPSSWAIDNLVMSCRVIGYGIETSLLATITRDAWASSTTRLEADFIRTSKNAPASDLFARHGFRADASIADVDATRWVLDRTDSPPQTPSWIRMVSHVA